LWRFAPIQTVFRSLIALNFQSPLIIPPQYFKSDHRFMASIALVHPGETLRVPALQVMNKCNTFQKNPALLVTPYRVRSSINLSIFREFVSALEGKTVNVTDTNLTGLSRLCEEFGFDEFAAQLSEFSQPSEDSQGRQIASPLAQVRSALLSESFQFIANGIVVESDVAESMALFPAVREQLSVDGCARAFVLNGSGVESADIRSLQLLVSGESISFGRSQELQNGLFENVNLERLFVNCSKAGIRTNLLDLGRERGINLGSADLLVLSVEALDSLLLSESVFVESEDALLQFILNCDPGYRDLLRHIQIGFLSDDGLSLLEEDFEIPPESLLQGAVEWIAHPLCLPLDSRIISGFPGIFAQFQRKHFKILWRGSRDGFGASEFHRRCDGHANTLIVILDTNGNIFGGFTPVEWELRLSSGWIGDNDNRKKPDDSLTSFVFTLKNPHNIPAMRFALMIQKKHQAIYCDSGWGAHFRDIAVSDECNTNTYSYTYLGTTYNNDTELDGDKFFTGWPNFKVEEIEVIEITD
jgi:hypothetical protein